MWFVATVIVVAWICVAVWLITKSIDENNALYAVMALFVVIGPFFYFISSSNEIGPCVQYETQMHYNAATKTTMPAKVCVNRGEWIN